MMTRFKLEGIDWPTRIEMMARVDDLTAAGNVRIMMVSHSDARWSSYQYNVACSMLGNTFRPEHTEGQQQSIQTKHGPWDHELGVVVGAVMDMLEEWDIVEIEDPDEPAEDDRA
ncbi:MAG: hypothetical protein V3S55_15330 [Nitrospiraceae bacterium]